MEAHQPPSGWYIDPADPSRERYWDGTVWTDQYRTAPTRVLQSPERIVEEERVLPQEEVPPEDRSGLARWGTALGAGIVGLLLGLVLGGGGGEAADTITSTVSETQTVTKTITRRARARTITRTVTEQAPAAPAPSGSGGGAGCDSNYTGCVPSGQGDVDCADVNGPVQVIGDDIYGLDRDGDGQACE
jgi:resuscitation-promoting factor RpfB